MPYNLARWNGTKWDLQRSTVIYRGNHITVPLYGIHAFSDTDIWLSGGVPIHWNGSVWTQYQLFDMGILGESDGYLRSIWGTSSTDVYFVGARGTAVHFDGTTWRRIDCRTRTSINDVWGTVDGQTGVSKAYFAVSSLFEPGDVSILQTSGSDNVVTIPWGPQRLLSSVWSWRGGLLYTAGDGVYELFGSERIPITSGAFGRKVRGTANNDIFVVGDLGFAMHNNGVDWHHYPELGNSETRFLSVAVKGNTVIVVGDRGATAFAVVGRK